MNVKELMKRFLEEEGFKYEWEDGFCCFKNQGQYVNVVFDNDMKNLLSFAIRYEGGALPRSVLLDICNEFNRRTVLKHYLIYDDSVVVRYDEFLTSIEVSNEAVMENLELLIHGACRLHDRMNELASYLSHPASMTLN